MPRAEIGTNLETGGTVEIDDNVRPSGTYILGKPGMGKSNLIELLILSQFATNKRRL